MKDMWTQFRKMPVWGQVVVGGLTAIVVIGVIGAATDGGSSNDKSKDGTTTESANRSAKTSTQPAKTKPKPKPAPAPKPAPPKPQGDPTVDKNTRAFLNEMAVCEAGVGAVMIDIKKGKLSDIALADDTTQARDVCDGVRDKLLTMSTDHFDDQAALGWGAIDRSKSGLNAMLAYIDNPRPSKVIEARDKIQEGDAGYAEAEREINQRRRVYGLRPYHP